MTRTLWKYRFVVLVLLVFSAVFAFLLRSIVGRDAVRDHSAFRKNRWGCAALVELCRSVRPGLRVETITEPLEDLSNVKGLLVIIDPETPFSEAELKELVRWVKSGGTLIAAFEGLHDDPASLRAAGGPAYVKLASALGVALIRQKHGLSTATPAPGSPEAVGVKQVAVDTRYALAPVGGQEAASRWAREELAPGNVDCLLPHKEGELTPRLVSDERLIMASFRHGRGRIYVSSDAQLFANSLLSREDNVQFIANLLWLNAARSTVFFDEYHHGFGRRMGAISQVDPSPLQRAIAVAVAGFVLFFAGKAIRFGTARPLFHSRRRTSMEYVEAMADLWQRAGANRWALEQIAAAFRHKITAAAGLAGGASPEALAKALAERRGVPEARTADLLANIDSALKAPTLTERQAARVVQQMTAFEHRLAARAFGSGH